MARRAFDDFQKDVLYSLRPNTRLSSNASVAVDTWETVRSTVDADASTFVVNVFNVDEVPWGVPRPTGAWYQVMGGRWHQPSSVSVAADVVSGVVISGPSQWSGQFVVSYKASILRSAWARFMWFCELVARVIIVALLVALAALILQYMPWSQIGEFVVQMVYAKTAHTSTFSPTPTAAPEGYGTQRIVVGKSTPSTPQ